MLLVATAVERTWGEGDDVLFLGEWCKLYDRKQIWETLASETLPYHWDDRDKLRRDFERLQLLNDELLIGLAAELNRLHCVDHSLRYWRLVLGYWLNLFTASLFDRWEMIRLALGTGKANRAIGLEIPHEEMAANDSAGFLKSILDDEWNQYIYQCVLQQSGFNVEYVASGESAGEKKNAGDVPRVQPGRRLRGLIRNSVDFLARITSRQSDPLLIGTYLPLRVQASLQLALGCVPNQRVPISVPQLNYNAAVRQWRLGEPGDSDDFESFVRSMLPLQLPKIFVEGYDFIKQAVNAAGWPDNPMFIFTATNHYDDDAFKIWAAGKVDKGTPFITAEHGGYWSIAFNGAIKYQMDVSDRSLSWGWEGREYPQVKAFGIVKLLGKRGKWDPAGDALMVGVSMPRYSFDIRSMVISGQMLGYFDDQYRFYDALPDSIRQRLLLRLYPSDYGWHQKQRWLDRFSDVRIDEGAVPLSTLIDRSRLFVSTYNGTTYWESIALNVPTIVFWNPLHWEIRDDAVPYFNRLKEVGIFHETPESAAAKVAEVWDDVAGWWWQSSIQEAREYVCHRFARQMDNPVTVLQGMLQSVVSEKMLVQSINSVG